MPNAVYDPETIKDKEAEAGSHDDLGTSPEQAQKEVDALQGNWDTDFGGKNTGGGKKKFWTRRKQAAGGLAGLGIGGVFVLFSILSGPAQLIHASQLLSNFHFAPSQNASSSRIGRLYEYFRARSVNDQSIRNVGYTAEKLTNRFMSQMSDIGIEMDFETPRGNDSRRIQAFRATNPDAIRLLESQGFEHSDGVFSFRNDGSPGANNLSSRERRKALYAAVDALDKGRFSSAITKRMLAARAGVDFHPFKNIARDAGESLSDWRTRRRQERSEKHKNGADAPDRIREIEGADGEDADGNTVDVPENDEAADATRDAFEEVNTEGTDVNTPEAKRGLVSKLLRGGGYATALVGVVCGVNAIGDSVDEYKHSNINLPMIRMAMEIIAMGSQIQAGQDLNLDEVGEVVDTFHSEEEGSFFGAAGMQAVAGEQEITGPDIDVKPSNTNEDKPEIFNIVGGIPYVDEVCGVQDAIGNLPIIKELGDASSSLVNGILSGTVGVTPDDLIARLVDILAGDLVNTFAQGTELGNIAAIGGRLSANSAAIASGGGEMSPAEFNTALNEFQKQEQLRIAQLPLKDRLFDLRSGNSLATTIIAKIPDMSSSSGVLSSVRGIPSLFSSLSSSILSIFTPRVSAATTYDFGVPAYGITQDMLEDEDLADPYAIENQILENPGAYEKYEKCYSTEINYVNGTISEKDEPSYETLNSDDCVENSPAARRYSMYMFDLVTFKGAACGYGIDEQACSEVGFGGGTQAQQSTNASATIVGDKAFPLAVSSKSEVHNGAGAPGSWQGTHNDVHEGYLSNDIYADAGTEVVAFADGVVTRLHSGGLGNGISVFNEESGLVIYYTHMEGIHVSEGQSVSAGDSLGTLASVADYPDINVDHLHIDASVGRTRGTCSRNGPCPIEDNFRDIGQDLYSLFQAIPD